MNNNLYRNKNINEKIYMNEIIDDENLLLKVFITNKKFYKEIKKKAIEEEKYMYKEFLKHNIDTKENLKYMLDERNNIDVMIDLLKRIVEYTDQYKNYYIEKKEYENYELKIDK